MTDSDDDVFDDADLDDVPEGESDDGNNTENGGT